MTDFHDYKFNDDFGTPDCTKQTMNTTEEDFKKVLISKGPMDAGIVSWNHALVLVGYKSRSNWKTIESYTSDKFCVTNEGCIPKTCQTKGEEKTICVNGIDLPRGQQGLIYKYRCDTLPYSSLVQWQVVGYDYCPYNSQCLNNTCQSLSAHQLTKGDRAGKSYQIKCTDNDHGGYCYWGTSEKKPASCPSTCKEQKDCDDTNLLLGPFDDNLNCTRNNLIRITTPKIQPFPSSQPSR